MSMTNTYVSNPGASGGPSGSGVSAPPVGAPGSTGPGANMPTAAAVGWLIALAAGVGIGTAYLGRKGAKPMLGHLDVFETVYNASTLLVVFGTMKVIAYRYHGHAVSQAVLLVL
jgi:hypothetical protein